MGTHQKLGSGKIMLTQILKSYQKEKPRSLPLWKQMAGALGIAILIVGYGSGKLIRQFETHHVLTTLEMQSDKTAALLSAVSVDAAIGQDIPLLETITKQAILKDPSIIALKIENMDNQILIDWHHPTNSNVVDRFSSCQAITYEEEKFGRLIISWDITQTMQELENRVWMVQVFTIGTLLFLTGLIIALLHKLVLHPVSKIDKCLLYLTYGDLSTPLHLPAYVSQELMQLGNLTNLLGESFSKRQEAEAVLLKNEQKLKDKTQQLLHAIRQIKKTQTQLIQNEKLSTLGQLVAGVAHEINNPVSFITGNLVHVRQYAEDLLEILNFYQTQFSQPNAELKALIEDKELDFIREDLPKTIASMENGAERIREIVLSLRNFSRLDEAEVKEVNIHDGIDSTLTILQSRLKAQPNRCQIKIFKQYGNIPEIHCYAGKLNQVFMNIIGNAIDALEESLLQNKIDEEPMIKIVTEVLDNKNILIRIHDNGRGIPQEVQKRLFDPFFTTKAVGKGTGLGLAISYQIVVEKHNGQLRCQSHPEGGTEFAIEIPIHS